MCLQSWLSPSVYYGTSKSTGVGSLLRAGSCSLSYSSFHSRLCGQLSQVWAMPMPTRSSYTSGAILSLPLVRSYPIFKPSGPLNTQTSCKPLMSSCTAIITACISPFRQFYTRQERGPGQARAVVDRITTYFNHMRGRNRNTSSITDDIPLAPYTGWSVTSPSSSSIEPTDPIVPLDSIPVR